MKQKQFIKFQNYFRCSTQGTLDIKDALKAIKFSKIFSEFSNFYNSIKDRSVVPNILTSVIRLFCEIPREVDSF